MRGHLPSKTQEAQEQDRSPPRFHSSPHPPHWKSSLYPMRAEARPPPPLSHPLPHPPPAPPPSLTFSPPPPCPPLLLSSPSLHANSQFSPNSTRHSHCIYYYITPPQPPHTPSLLHSPAKPYLSNLSVPACSTKSGDHTTIKSQDRKLQRSTGDKKHIDTRTQLGKGTTEPGKNPKGEDPPSPHTRTQGVHTETTCGQQRSDNIPQEPPMELATTEKPGTLATQEGTETVAPQDPEELAPQRHPQRMASTKTRKHPMGPRNSRRKAVARRNERLLGMELIVTEVNLTKDQLSLLHKGRSFVPGPPRKSIQLEALSSSLGKLEDDANRNFTEALLPGQKILPTREKRKWPPQLPAIPRKKESPRKMPGLHEKVTEHMQS
ncbi:hypothetical protein C7M84_019566 [Penaeus vannamei]|uniref:Uncharacterized protein n=1 Tax=Penaeus vannamei TaxID=6689 RepID=A0A423SEI2_PENVA|nr:hypothetical protein C7M84_019566 [Penaeus vannamei]